MKYVAIITGFNNHHSRKPIRAFPHADEARQWVGAIHRLLNEDCDKGIGDDFVEEGELYRIAKDGTCVLIDEFSGLDRGDGVCGGWENECQWQSQPDQNGLHWGCSHSRVKDSKMCWYHKQGKNTPYCAPPSGLSNGTWRVYETSVREKQLRKDIAEPPSPLIAFASLLKTKIASR